MDMSMSVSMGGMMTIAAGVPSPFDSKYSGLFIGTAIGVATIANVLNRIIHYQPLSGLISTSSPARPKAFFFRAHAPMSVIIREYDYYSLPLSFRKTHFYLPPVGSTTILVAYAVLIVVCAFYKLDPEDLLQWEDVGYRVGFIAICQIPLIVLLAGKRNIIGFLTGVGYERLNWLQRWVARALLIVLIHMGFFLTEWGKYDYIVTKIKEDPLTRKGIIASSILLWLVLSSVAPIRNLSYEIFVVQHIIS